MRKTSRIGSGLRRDAINVEARNVLKAPNAHRVFPPTLAIERIYQGYTTRVAYVRKKPCSWPPGQERMQSGEEVRSYLARRPSKRASRRGQK